MAKCILPYFGQLDTDQLEEYYDASLHLNGIEVQLDLNFDNKKIAAARLDIAKRFLEQITDFDFKNRKYIEQDFEDKNTDTVRTYIDSHLEDMGEDELDSLVDRNNKKVSPEKQLMKQLHLVRMGLYPDSEDQFAIFDYSIGRELTQYLVVIFTDEFGNLDYMTMES